MIDIFLQPGELFVGDADYRVRTLLGSCVSIILWHPKKKIGAMSHFLLAQRNGQEIVHLDGRYGDEAMLLLLKELIKADVDPTGCKAKIIGGGNMFPQIVKDKRKNIGDHNGEAAQRILLEHRIPVVSEHLFGVGHRQVIFNIKTGRVWVKHVESYDNKKYVPIML